MNEEDRKFLTEWGGDCWHEFDWAVGGRRCKKCGEWDLENRTFDTWEDFGWLWEKVTEKGLLDDLIRDMCLSSEHYNNMYTWIDWEYKSPEDRCQLICDFLREQEITDTLAIKEQEGEG